MPHSRTCPDTHTYTHTCMDTCSILRSACTASTVRLGPTIALWLRPALALTAGFMLFAAAEALAAPNMRPKDMSASTHEHKPQERFVRLSPRICLQARMTAHVQAYDDNDDGMQETIPDYGEDSTPFGSLSIFVTERCTMSAWLMPNRREAAGSHLITDRFSSTSITQVTFGTRGACRMGDHTLHTVEP
eukprot:1159499-Pelagomonas_calceolata.AAC.8